MTDEFGIQQTVSRYCDAANRRDWDQIVEVFAADAVWEVPSIDARLVGHAAIREGFAALTADSDYIVQLNAPSIITVDGNTASARTVVRECGKYSGRAEAFDMVGCYIDRLVKTADGWKFSHRRLEVQGMHRYAVLG